MEDKNKTENKGGKLSLSSSKLSLGGVKGGKVSQNLSRGHVHSVTVEVKKKRRTFSPDGKPAPKVDSKSISESLGGKATEKPEGKDASSLTESETIARMKALKDAGEREKQEEILRQERQEKEKLEQIAREKEEEEVRKAAELKKQIAEEPEEEVAQEEPKVQETYTETPDSESDSLVKPIKSSERISSNTSKDKIKKVEKRVEEKPSKTHREDSKRRSNKLTIAQALSGKDEERMRSMASVRRAREKAKAKRMGDSPREKEKIIREVIVPEVITVQELANRMAERVVDVTKALMKMGMMVTANQTIDADTAELVISEFGHKIKRVTDADIEDILKIDDSTDMDNLESRAPVVTFMGHVDHGKTSLLDAIRKAKVASGEAGGITQHIGAYQVVTDSGEKITFLDTPGHEAFTEMRKRGATATDVVVLVVAADDGIMAQTVEAIHHAKAANVPIIVAINKIDKPDADIQKVKNSLLEHELVSEDLGGDTLIVEVSAKQALNLDKLLDAILLQSEFLELQANAGRKAAGVVVESRVDKGRGVVATVLVQKGTLKIGDIVVAGTAFGKVRAMVNDKGSNVKSAEPSVPVEILGLSEAPEAGSEVAVPDSEKQAREITEYRIKHKRDLKTAAEKKGSLDELFQQAAEGGIDELPIVIKGDVQGSVEAIIASLNKLSTDEVSVRVLHDAVGGITISDVSLAGASRAIVLGFNVRADAAAKELAVKDGIDIRYYSIIYDLIDDIKSLLSGMLKPLIRENFLGNAEIREVFNVSKSGKVAGCYVTEGMIKRGAGVRLLRDNVVTHEGKLKTLRRFKDDVKEVGTNFECGMAFENYDDIKVGDFIEAFEMIEEERQL